VFASVLPDTLAIGYLTTIRGGKGNVPRYVFSTLALCRQKGGLLKMDVLCMMVNYNSEPEAQRFIRDFLRSNGCECFLMVVDNSDRLPLDSQLASLHQNVEILRPERNLGYFGAVSWAWGRFRQHKSLPAWVIVCNADVQLPDPSFFENMINLHADSSSAVIAPAILSCLSGKDQNPFMERRPTRSRMVFYKWVFRFEISCRTYLTLSYIKRKLAAYKRCSLVSRPTSPRCIYAPHGSFMVFRHTYFEAGGSFDYYPFLFGEEIFVGETARRLNLVVEYDPRLVVHHDEHVSTSVFRNPEILKYYRESSAYLADRFFGGD